MSRLSHVTGVVWLLIGWTASSEFGTYRLCEQRRYRRACASAQSRQNLRCSLIQAVSQEEPSDRKPDPWPIWMAGHAQLKFVMAECSKTQIRLTRPRVTFRFSRATVLELLNVKVIQSWLANKEITKKEWQVQWKWRLENCYIFNSKGDIKSENLKNSNLACETWLQDTFMYWEF